MGLIIGVLDPVKNLVTGKAFQDKESGYKTNEIKLSPKNKNGFRTCSILKILKVW